LVLPLLPLDPPCSSLFPYTTLFRSYRDTEPACYRGLQEKALDYSDDCILCHGFLLFGSDPCGRYARGHSIWHLVGCGCRTHRVACTDYLERKTHPADGPGIGVHHGWRHSGRSWLTWRRSAHEKSHAGVGSVGGPRASMVLPARAGTWCCCRFECAGGCSRCRDNYCSVAGTAALCHVLRRSVQLLRRCLQGLEIHVLRAGVELPVCSRCGLDTVQICRARSRRARWCALCFTNALRGLRHCFRRFSKR